MYTSKQILDAEDLYDLAESDSFQYLLTDGEIGWLHFITGRYSIADYIEDNLDADNVVTLDPYGISEALQADNGNSPFATCLSEDTALAKIFFWLFIEDINNE